MDEKVQQIKDAINVMDNKDFTIYFFVLDTKGNPTAGIANIYEHAKVLTDEGYSVKILHEEHDYKLRQDPTKPETMSSMGVAEWLGSEYADLPHVCIKDNIAINNTDFIIIPEIFANIMDQLKNIPCKKVVLSQSYNYVLDLLTIGARWNNYGFNDVITTSDKQAEYLRTLFPHLKYHTVPVSIPDYFKSTDKMKDLTVSIVTRDQADAVRIAKSFYLQFPIYKFVTFKELRGLDRKTFAEDLGRSCLAVWVDDVSGFGTFPLEAIECDTPVIGKIPNMIPEWMEDKVEGNEVVVKNNGVWTNNVLSIPELIANYVKVWLEDSVPTEILAEMESSKGQYTSEKQIEKIKEVYSTLIEDRKAEYTNMLPSEEEKV
jgi:hypothetical protein